MFQLDAVKLVIELLKKSSNFKCVSDIMAIGIIAAARILSCVQ
jgi:hypothetical protein